jgi:hypothetical protein
MLLTQLCCHQTGQTQIGPVQKTIRTVDQYKDFFFKYIENFISSHIWNPINIDDLYPPSMKNCIRFIVHCTRKYKYIKFKVSSEKHHIILLEPFEQNLL